MAVLVPATRLSNRPSDNRQDYRDPVAKSALKTVLVADGVNTNSSQSVKINGQVTTIIASSPAIPTDADYTITLKSIDGVTTFAKASISDNGVAYVDVSGDNWFCNDTFTITVSFTTVLSGNTATFDLIFMYIDP